MTSSPQATSPSIRRRTGVRTDRAVVAVTAAGVSIAAAAAAVGRMTGSARPVFEQLVLPGGDPVFSASVCLIVTALPMAVLAIRSARNRRTTAPTAFTAGVLTSAWALIHVLLFHAAWAGGLWFAAGVVFAVTGWREMFPSAATRRRDALTPRVERDHRAAQQTTTRQRGGAR